MLIVLILAALAVLVASLIIAIVTSRTDLRDADSSRYLYGFNRPLLAAFGNTGSILSVTFVFAVLLPSIVGWGYSPIAGVTLGLVVGYIALGFVITRVKAAQRGDIPRTLPELLPTGQKALAWAQIIMLTALIWLELLASRTYVQEILHLNGVYAFLCIVFIACLCGLYTSHGGFVGELRTDALQATVILVGFGLAVMELADVYSHFCHCHWLRVRHAGILDSKLRHIARAR